MPEDSNEDNKFAIYFSHSWRPRDVDLNLLAWGEVGGGCEMVVDVPDEGGADPPYFINRIEELLRRSDLFLCVLTHRVEADRAGADRSSEGPDGALQCSAYALFEIRLAERFDLPRLVLYERSTGFKAPRTPRANELYIAFDRGAADPVPEHSQWRRTIAPKIRRWMEWAVENRRPGSDEQQSLAVGLLPEAMLRSGRCCEILESALHAGGYERVALRAAFRSNIEAFQILRSAGLVITDLNTSDPVARELSIAAHVLGIPAIRMACGAEGQTGELPWLLRGHPGGYQHDIVRFTNPDELLAPIQSRARAMFRISRAFGDGETRGYLNSKRYSQYFIFISHTLKPPHRALVEQIYEGLGRRYVKPFEYHLANASGDDWKAELDKQLRKTTHFVLLLTDGYELSPVCTYEIEEILKRTDVKILPFMAGGRSVPHPKLGALHHRLLNATDTAGAAEVVVQQVMETLAGASAQA